MRCCSKGACACATAPVRVSKLGGSDQSDESLVCERQAICVIFTKTLSWGLEKSDFILYNELKVRVINNSAKKILSI